MFLKFLQKSWPFLIIILIAFAFHIKLFFPQPSVFVTPDYGRSDLYTSKLPTEFIMWKNLHNLSLPLWEKNIYQGFPVLDETGLGFFFIQNFVLFGLLPFWLAFNLGYVINVIFAACGIYFLTRSFQLNKISSLIAALTFTFSPIFTLHYHHYNMLFAIAIIPWLFWSVNSFFNTKKFFFLALIPFLIGEQFLIAWPQIPVYNVFFLVAFFLFKLKGSDYSQKLRIKVFFVFLIMMVLGLLIASIQLLPSYIHLGKTQWLTQVSPQDILTEFPFKFKNLLTILDPYILGDIRKGTYPHWQPGSWGIFWESNVYFGIIQFALVISSVFIFTKKSFRKYLNIYTFWFCVFILGILLSLGHEAPLHPIFSIPPFSFFRVPSRFLFFSFLAASQIVALTVNSFYLGKRGKRIVIGFTFVLLTLIIADIFRVWFNYNMVGSVKDWFKKPELAYSITTNGRLINVGDSKPWNEIFLEKGWKDQESKYLFLRNFITQNSNIIFDINHFSGYESLIPKRIQFVQQLSLIDNKENGGEYEIGKTSQKVLNMSYVRYLTTPFDLTSKDWHLLKTVENNNQKVKLWENLAVLPHAYFVSDYKIASSRNEVIQTLQSEDFDPSKTTILEEPIDIEKVSEKSKDEVNIKIYDDELVQMEAKSRKKQILILSDTYFDGWHAFIDGKETKIYPANVNSRAIIVPEGTHSIDFRYFPKIFYESAAITAFGSIFALLLLIKLRHKRIKD